MPNKILFISNTANFSKFNRPYMQLFKSNGWQVDYVSKGEEKILDCDNQYKISIERNPYDLNNFKAYKELKKILFNNYDIIHCHTPMGGFLGRLAAKNLKTKTKIIYTAHGFHFYKGAPFIYWIIYYPIEKYLSNYTDILITLNNEDYTISKKKFISCKNIYKIDGAGVDLNRFRHKNEEEKNNLRNIMGFKKEDFLLLYIAEFIPRKNHKIIFKLIKKIKNKINNVKIIFMGTGTLINKYKKYTNNHKLSEIVSFLGYRNDIENICGISDIAISVSKQEGLPIAIVECLASGLPVVCSRIRGHIDIIIDRRNGLLFNLNKPKQMVDLIFELYNDANLRKKIREFNLFDRERYSLDNIINKMSIIYNQEI